MINPRVEVNQAKLKQNVEHIVGLCEDKGISVAGVTKCFCALPEIAQVYVDGGCKFLADSRLENLEKLKDLGLPRLMLRLPMISQATETVRHAEMSLNSELATIKALNQAAQAQGLVHQIILMVDLGDLREGFYYENKLYDSLAQIIELKSIQVIGLGVNLTCFGGVIPDKENLSRLVAIKNHIKIKYDMDLELISGGNSSSLYLIEGDGLVEGINNLRIGEAFLLGRETAYGQDIPGTEQDVFTLVAEIIELKDKPTVPTGIIGKNAFGETPEFEDLGIRKAAICAIGQQDVNPWDLTPEDKGVKIKGASSDHLVLDVTDSKLNYQVGSEIRFAMSYGGILATMTSPYVHKELIAED